MLLNIYLTALLCGTALALWPIPSSITTGTSAVWIAKDVEITYNGGPLPWNYGYTTKGPDFSSKEIIAGGVARAMEAIMEKSFVPWKLYPRNKVQDVEPAAKTSKTYIAKLEITQTSTDSSSTWKPKAGEVDESYSLCLETDGKATIKAASSVGVLRALESFTQLFFKHSEGGIYSALAPVDITDEPTFPHRGILLDVARNWYPVASIYRTLDAMSWNKMNRLHIHVTDSQSWPLEIPAMPAVAEKGAYGKGLTYSPEDITSIQSYAVQRGIEVIFEIDMPGHIGIVAESFPDIITGYNAQPWTTYCAEPPCGQFQLNNSKVDTFLDKLMDDLLPRLSPYTAYFHQGGDEFNFEVYNMDPTVGTNDTEVLGPLLQKFTDKMFERVRKFGLNPMVWEEIPLKYNMTIDKDVVVQSWLGEGAVANITKAGNPVIDSNYNFWYLDCGRGGWIPYANDVFDKGYPFNDWCGPTKSWGLMYSHNPRAGLPEEQANLVLGGEVAVWSETIDDANLDSVVWPRASAAGEVLWSGATTADGGNRSQIDAMPRLNEMRERMLARGVNAQPLQPVSCTQGMNGTTCQFL